MIEIPWLSIAVLFSIILLVGMIIAFFGMTNLHWCALLGIAMVIIGGVGWFVCDSQRPFETTPASSWNTIEIQNISSLSGGDSFGVLGHGSFFLGSGSATVNGNTRQIYTFFKVIPSGGYQKGTLDAEGVTVLEDAPLYPYIEWDYSHARTPLKRYTDDGSISGGQVVDKLIATYIHVPNGTVMQEFKV